MNKPTTVLQIAKWSTQPYFSIRSKILEHFLPPFPQLHLDVFVDCFLSDWIVPLPFQIHSLALLLSHHADVVVFVLNHHPLLVFASVQQSVDRIVLLFPPQLGFGRVEVEGIFELESCFPAMFGRKATPKDVISPSVAIRLLWVLCKEVMNINIFDLVKLQKLNYFVCLWPQPLELNFFWGKH